MLVPTGIYKKNPTAEIKDYNLLSVIQNKISKLHLAIEKQMEDINKCDPGFNPQPL